MNLKGLRVCVVGCGNSLYQAGLGGEIDAHDIVIRCNRSFLTKGIESDWGSKTDYLVVGNPDAIMPLIPKGFIKPVYTFPQSGERHRLAWESAGYLMRQSISADTFRSIWPHQQKPLAGTFAALLASFYRPASITLYGLDLYSFSKRRGNCMSNWSVFKGHPNNPPSLSFDMSLDRRALDAIPNCSWKLRQSVMP